MSAMDTNATTTEQDAATPVPVRLPLAFELVVIEGTTADGQLMYRGDVYLGQESVRYYVRMASEFPEGLPDFTNNCARWFANEFKARVFGV